MKRIFLSLAGFVALFGLMAAPVQSRAGATNIFQTQTQPEAKKFTGTIQKSGENFVLSELATKSSSLLKKASDPVIAGAARDFSSPKANKKRDSISHHFPE
jgi:hypothetical protein